MCDTPNNPKPSQSGKFLDQDTWEALQAAGFTKDELSKDQPFGPVIFAYTRKQAIEDGVLVDLTQPGFARILALHGVRVHAAMTATCFAEVVIRELTPDTAWESLCRFGKVLQAFRIAVGESGGKTDRVYFTIDGVDDKPVAMYAHIGPGDAGEPVLTFMLEGED